MNVYTSRYSNKTLQSRNYTAVRISVGKPKWSLGYNLDGEMKSLMPFGLFGVVEDYDEFEPLYFDRLDSIGVETIRAQLNFFLSLGKDVVLLCYEDVRKPDQWCHRTAFAKWWQLRTGETIEELPEPNGAVVPFQRKSAEVEQMSLLDMVDPKTRG